MNHNIFLSVVDRLAQVPWSDQQSYNVMQSVGNSFCGDIVSDSSNIIYSEEDMHLRPKI